MEKNVTSKTIHRIPRGKSYGHVTFVGAGPGDPELLTLKACRVLQETDVIIHDHLVEPTILSLAKENARIIDAGKTGFGPSTDQHHINQMLITYARDGAQITRLKGGDATLFSRIDDEIEALEAEHIGWHIVPGITSASAAVAAIGQAFTKRQRNTSVRFITAHDVNGFAEHDWQSLARHHEIIAIYMGKKAYKFIQGRLLMYGGSSITPITIIENVSRKDQKIYSTTLASSSLDTIMMNLTGPALVLIGLEPRAQQIRKQPKRKVI